MSLNERMAKLEEKVNNIKDSLDDVVKNKLPSIEKKIELLARYVYIGIGMGILAQLILSHFIK